MRLSYSYYTLRMFEANVTRLLGSLSPDALVLDVGGWACPLNRAQYALDAEPYDSRGYYKTFGGAPFQGGEREWFSRDTWVQRDICAREPWPFADNQFDFVTCSHTLEDLRDPLWVCSELMRVAKAGYIEVPSRVCESTVGVERPKMAGLSHHRWLIDIDGDEIRFLPKYHMIHTDWRFTVPLSHLRSLGKEGAVQWIWWQGSFRFAEVTIHGLGAQERELERFAASVYPRSPWRLAASKAWRASSSLPRRAVRRVRSRR